MAKDDHFAKFHAFVTYTSITPHFNTTPLLTACSCVAFVLHKCKKHSLSHQLTAQLRIENSKNKKMVITLLQHIA